MRGVACAVLALAAGCGARLNPVAMVDAAGLRATNQPFGIRHRTNGELIGADWRIDNFQSAEEGLGPPKEGDEYQHRVAVDEDDDGVVDTEPRIYSHLLLLRHRTSDARMWVRFVPLRASEEETRLDVLVDRLVEAISGSGSITTAMDYGAASHERTYATRLVDGHEAQLAGRDAYVATIEVANVDQLHISPEARWQRARIVLVRADLEWWVRPRRTDPSLAVPVILLAGYANRPAEFDESLPDFADLVSRMYFTNAPEEHRTAAIACGGDEGARFSHVVGRLRRRAVFSSYPEHRTARDCFEELENQMGFENGTDYYVVTHRYWSGPSPYADRPAASAVAGRIEPADGAASGDETSPANAATAEESGEESPDTSPGPDPGGSVDQGAVDPQPPL